MTAIPLPPVEDEEHMDCRADDKERCVLPYCGRPSDGYFEREGYYFFYCLEHREALKETLDRVMLHE